MLFHAERQSVTLSGGATSFNTQRFSGAMLVQIIVTPTTSTNTYDFTITNPSGDVVFTRTGLEGTFNESDMGVPLIGANTVAIANATTASDPVVIVLVVKNA